MNRILIHERELFAKSFSLRVGGLECGRLWLSALILIGVAQSASATQDDSTDPQGSAEKVESTEESDDPQTSEEGPDEPEVDEVEASEVLPSLDEAVPFSWSWESLGGVLRGREPFTTKDGSIDFRLGASLQVDGTTATESDRLKANYGQVDSSVDFRRVRLSSHGRVRQMNFMASFDLGADAGIKDLWLEGQEGGLALWGKQLGKFRFGQIREPFSFERQTGNANTGFLERSLPVQTFAPGRNFGFLIHDVSDGGRVHWAGGVFSLGSSNEDDGSDSRFSLTGRVSGLPLYRDDGKSLLHIGASVSSRTPNHDTRYFSRPEARFADPLADTGDIDASAITLVGAELAGVHGPWWAQAEWIVSHLEAPQSGNPNFQGGYLQVGYILSGGKRSYRNNGGVFDRYRPEEEGPKDKFLDLNHGGTWEVAGRVSRSDLNDAEIRGGELMDYSIALNFYPTWATRINLNYIYADTKDRGNANILLLRVQYSPW